MRLREEFDTADAVVIGAGSGLSTSAGFTYTGERFQKYFSDFIVRYGFGDMYSGGFYPFDTLEEHWAWWSRHIWINRYMDAPKPVYKDLLLLLKDKDYFILTTNVDHQFQKAGFDRHRLFYTQGDYGLWQCSVPCHNETYDNESIVRKMAEAQGFIINENDELIVPEGKKLSMVIPSELIPYCPHCHKPMTMNLRCDMSFVQDKGWYEACDRYEDFLRRHQNQHILFLELGVGSNTPGIIKYPFWRMTQQNPKAVYTCINLGDAWAPREIENRSICIDGDIGEVLKQL